MIATLKILWSIFLKPNIKVEHLLLGLPLARREGAGILDSSSWNTFTYHGIRGY